MPLALMRRRDLDANHVVDRDTVVDVVTGLVVGLLEGPMYGYLDDAGNVVGRLTPPGREAAGQSPDEPPPPALVFQTLAELAAEVDAAGPRKWLLRGVWPAGDYGVHAAEQKAQKTWNTADLVISVASGTPWLGTIEVDAPGPVLMFVGEGGKANTVRRLRAVAEARGLVAETLPIVVCTRAPHLADQTHLQLLAAQVHAQRPMLVTLDPLYLSAAGASLADLYAMGALLERPQRLCQAAGAALWIVTHFNRKPGNGAGRITGAGPAEWGRVLISGEVKSRRTDPNTRASDVVTELQIIGGEVPDRALTLHRRIWSDDPDDLDAPLHLECTVTEHDAPQQPESESGAQRPERFNPATVKILEVLRTATGPRSSKELVDSVAARHGHGLKRTTAATSLNILERAGLAKSVDLGPGLPKDWVYVDQSETDNPRSNPSANSDQQMLTGLTSGFVPKSVHSGQEQLLTDHEMGNNRRSNVSATGDQLTSATGSDKTAGQTRRRGVADASALTPTGGVSATPRKGVAAPDTPQDHDRCADADTPRPDPVTEAAVQLLHTELGAA
ncbi:MAG: ATP-binding protein, partial [Pseudonocardiaceae bacterium]